MSETGQVSDGHHTFDELYEHRHRLFIALMRSHTSMAWRANNHADGTMFENWFIAGLRLTSGDISYHLPVRLWESLDGCRIATTLRAPPWDGHTPDIVLIRLAYFHPDEEVDRLRGLLAWASGRLLDAGDHEGAEIVLHGRTTDV